MTIVKAIAGSQLFGLSTPASDTDYKMVYQASLEDIVLKKDKESSMFSTGGKGKNSSEDIDIEGKELRKFLNDCMAGQTYAVELLYTPEDKIVETSDTWKFIQANKDKLRPNNLKPFVGYAFSQANKYSLRGLRLDELRQYEKWLSSKPGRDLLGDYVDELTDTEMIFKSKFVRADNSIEYRIVACGMVFQYGKMIQECLPTVRKRLKQYGDRAEKALQAGNVDWKAYSHAFRLLYEWEELVTTGELQFPNPNSEYVLDVKLGKYTLDEVQEKLWDEFRRIDLLPNNLPAPDPEFWQKFIIKKYLDKKHVIRLNYNNLTKVKT